MLSPLAKRSLLAPVAALISERVCPTRLLLPRLVPILSTENFGLLIAYLLPGFVAVWGARPLVPGIDAWLAASPGTSPTVGGFLFVTLASIAAGMLASTVRWLLLDSLHHRTGIPQPAWDFSRFPASVAAFDSLVQDHYRYYQHYGNMLAVLGFVYVVGIGGGIREMQVWEHLAFVVTAIVLYLGSRDALRKYYQRTAVILQRREAPRPRSAANRTTSLGRRNVKGTLA